jgi:hypothetical protein
MREKGGTAGIAYFARLDFRSGIVMTLRETRLYFVYLAIRCEKAKEWRSSDDLLQMSKVRELELAAIARVKECLNHEPLLNKK